MAELHDAEIALSALQNKLSTTIAEFVGEAVEISQLQQLTAGAAAQTWRFQASYGGQSQTLILRSGIDADQFAGALKKADEAIVINAAVAVGVIAPRILGILQPGHGLGEGFVMECIDGESLPPKILRDPTLSAAREKLAAQCGEALAQIHAVPRSELSHLPVQDAKAQLDFYQQSYQRFGMPLPVFDAAFQYLSQHQFEAELTLVHGDFRNGNILVDENGLSGVLDWELSHIGDPMEDLGWLCVNSWRFGQRDKPVGGFGTREQLFSAYEQASGLKVDPARVNYWELFGVLKWGVLCLYQCEVHLSGAQRSVERAAIGRRVSECELDIIALLEQASQHQGEPQ
ncbi:phosphotransferase family protein [Spongiibacter sp. KMU-158]|uniref:Phosphotransferase family protein n=1 Tax=Spongiibacter pelagi TaxID=2760804 RepID=A0A927BZT6_9GAMM|nr:phosphotransferase family protein [Spongiibacter pelagi]MBD2858084.1 phosphotransferase family protein [Spongiibacter pelagi]